MNTMAAFAMGEASRNNEAKVFDWEKAARLIRDRNASYAEAGLSGDWEYTGGAIFRDGKIVPEEDTYVYLSSTWATPEIEIDGETIACYKMESEVPDWDSKTYWPKEALEILNQKTEDAEFEIIQPKQIKNKEAQ